MSTTQKYCFLICTLAIFYSASAQPTQYFDSLYNAAQQADNPEEKIKLFTRYALTSPRNLTDSIRPIAERLDTYSQTFAGSSIKGIQNYLYAVSFLKKRNLDSAYFFISKSIIPIQKGTDDHLKSNVFADMAMLYGRRGKNDSALYYSRLALPFAEKANPGILKKIYGNMGIYFRKAGAYDQSINTFKKVLSLPGAQSMDTLMAYMAIGSIYMQNGNHQQGIDFLKSTYHRAPVNSQFQASILGNIAEAFGKLEQYDSSLYYLNRAYSIIEEAPRAKQLILSNRLRAANIYISRDEIPEARKALMIAKRSPIRSRAVENLFLNYIEAKIFFHEGSYEEVIRVAEPVIGNVGKLISSDLDIKFREFFRIVIQSYEELDQKEDMSNTMSLYIDYLENTELDRARKELADLNIAYKTREKEQALASSLTSLENNRKVNLLLTFAIIAMIIALLSLGFTYNSVRSKNLQLKSQNDKIKVLIRELHHRVKNNLQIISSLLGLQSMKIQGDEAKAAFNEGKSRVNAMAMIHQKLYQKDDLEKVNISEYLEELINNLKSSFDSNSKVVVNMEVTDAQFNMDKAIPVGLILNELITNSFKYAFDDIQQPILDIKLIQESDQYQLSISDNGKELEQSFELDNSSSFGLRLVNLLVDQLNGKLSLKQANHLKTFSIQFQ